MRCGPAEPRPGLRGRWTIASEAPWAGRKGRREEGGMRCGPAEPRPGLRGRWTIASEATWQGRREEGHVGQWRRQPDHFVGGTLAGEEGGGRGIYVKGECGFSG